MIETVRRVVLFSLALGCTTLSSGQDVVITEFMARRTDSIRDDDGDRAEFIELYNAGTRALDLGGYFLSDHCVDRFRWSFPEGVSIGPTEFLVVWATEKDRTDPCCDLHTNFRLDGDGECLVLSDAAGEQLDIFEFFPEQVRGYSYGIPMFGEQFQFVSASSPCLATVPGASNPVEGIDWTMPSYDDSAWLRGTTGVGFDVDPDYLPFLGLDFGNAMHNINATCYIRIPFQVDDPAAVASFEFGMKYDDGFIAYINGTRVASRNAPEVGTSTSEATHFRLDSQAIEFQEVPISEGTPILHAGVNLLAIHGLNESIDSSDLLILPTLNGIAESLLDRHVHHHFPTPTPGAENVSGAPGVAGKLLLSEPSGAYAPGLSVAVSTVREAVDGTLIRFTIDGSMPEVDSPVYTEPLVIESEVILTARAFAPGLLPGEPVSAHYMVLDEDVLDFTSTIPVVICSILGEGLPSQCGAGPYAPGRFLIFAPGEDGRTRLSDAPHLAHKTGYRRRGNPFIGCHSEKVFFNVEFRNSDESEADVEFMDFAPHADFAMLGLFDIDRSFMRNPLAYWMSREIGRWAPRTQFVECFLHTGGAPKLSMSSYWGVYVLTERIERGVGRVDVDRLIRGLEHNQQPEITGGYIVQRDRTKTGDVSINAGGYGNIVFAYPRSPTADQKDYLRRTISSAVASLNSRIGSQRDNGFIDVGSFLDHHILMWYPKNVDAFRFSAYMTKPRGGPLIAGPIWDYDRSMGANDPRCATPEGWNNDNVGDGGARYFVHPGPPGDSGTLGSWFGHLFDNLPPTGTSAWHRAYRSRWRELRAGPLSTENVLGQIDEWFVVLEEPAERDYLRFRLDDRRTYLGEVNHLKDWLQTRAEWIDEQFRRVDGLFADQRLQGDLDGNGRLNISDTIRILRNLFGSVENPCTTPEANLLLQDTDGDGELTTTDALHLLHFLFLNGPPPGRGVECTLIRGCPETCG